MNGRGCLQISAAKKDGEVVDADLREFAAEDLESGAKTWDIQLGEFVGFSFHFGDGELYWQHWYVGCGSVAVFVTYNCDLEARGTEDDAVDEMLRSLTLR